jgi:hypothetical protein
MPGVRPLAEGDIPQVADLLWRILHERKGSAPPGLRVYVQELFLSNPWLEEGIVSRVCEDSSGKIVAFYGVVPRRMTFQGKTIRMAYGSNFVVDPGSRVSMAAIQLVKTFMKGPQDVSITDSANESSRQLLRSLGFAVVPIYSLQWARPLRPSLYALQAVARLKKKSRLAASIGTLSRPFCAPLDGLLARIPLSPLRQTKPLTTGEDLTLEALLNCLATIPGKHLLLPEYNKDTLEWTVGFLARRKTFGDLRSVLVREKDGKTIGWFIYYLAPGKVGEVVQIGAAGPSISKVLDHLFYDAWKHRLIGLHGRMEPQFMEELTRKSCFFFRNGSWTLVHSSRPELVALIQSGTAFFSRLDGEWALRPGRDELEG